MKAPEVGLLATLGVQKIKVFKRVKVGVLSTGDELVSPYSAEISFGKIRDSNKAMLMTLL